MDPVADLIERLIDLSERPADRSEPETTEALHDAAEALLRLKSEKHTWETARSAALSALKEN